MIYHLVETNSSRSNVFSKTEKIEAQSHEDAAKQYLKNYKTNPRCSHLEITEEDSEKMLLFAINKKDTTNNQTILASGSDSGWATVFYIFGSINLVGSAIGFLALLDSRGDEKAQYFISTIVGLGSGLTCFFFGYVTQILSDCRRYLKKMSDGK